MKIRTDGEDPNGRLIQHRMEIVKTQKLLSSVLNANAQKIKVDSQLDSVWTPEGNAWFMAGYKDQMVSYCVGYKNGKRQDFIKVIRPK